MPLLVAEQRTQAWLDAHLYRITSSTAAAVLGVGREGPLAAYRGIMGLHKKKQNAYMKWGVDNEDKARRLYQAETGEIARTTGFWVHELIDYLGASPDGLVGENGGLEIKCPQSLPKEIPIWDEVQMRVQMAVVSMPGQEIDWWDYLAWHPKGFFLARLHRDAVEEAIILAKLDKWYHDHIATKTPPPRRKKEVTL
jgi:hypothetical protein